MPEPKSRRKLAPFEATCDGPGVTQTSLVPRTAFFPPSTLEVWDDASWRAAQNWVAVARLREPAPILGGLVLLYGALMLYFALNLERKPIPRTVEIIAQVEAGLAMLGGLLMVLTRRSWARWFTVGVLALVTALGNWSMLIPLLAVALEAMGRLDLGSYTARPWSSWFSLLVVPLRFLVGYGSPLMPVMTIQRVGHARLRDLPPDLPRFVESLERRAQRVHSAPANAPGIVRFIVDGREWRMELHRDGAILAAAHGNRWEIAARTSFAIKPGDLDGLDDKGDPYVILRFGEWAPHASLSHADLARLCAWKESGATGLRQGVAVVPS